MKGANDVKELKGFFARLMDKMDRKLEKQSKECCCCCDSKAGSKASSKAGSKINKGNKGRC
jgi:hypothetical protein